MINTKYNGVINIYTVVRNTYDANLRDSNMSTKLFCFNTLHISFGNRYAIPKRLTIFYQSRPSVVHHRSAFRNSSNILKRKLIIHKEKIFIACILVIEFRDIRLDKHLNKLEKPYQIGGNNGK